MTESTFPNSGNIASITAGLTVFVVSGTIIEHLVGQFQLNTPWNFHHVLQVLLLSLALLYTPLTWMMIRRQSADMLNAFRSAEGRNATESLRAIQKSTEQILTNVSMNLFFLVMALGWT
jgi:hypothetical protein